MVLKPVVSLRFRLLAVLVKIPSILLLFFKIHRPVQKFLMTLSQRSLFLAGRQCTWLTLLWFQRTTFLLPFKPFLSTVLVILTLRVSSFIVPLSRRNRFMLFWFRKLKFLITRLLVLTKGRRS